MFPWKCCELYGALNLFGRSCQANEVSEWGRPGGGRGQPRASAACQAAVLRGPSPRARLQLRCGAAPPRQRPGTLRAHLPYMNANCLAKERLHSCMCGPLVHVKSMYIGTRRGSRKARGTHAHTQTHTIHCLERFPSSPHKTSMRADCPHQLPVEHSEWMLQCMHQYEQFF